MITRLEKALFYALLIFLPLQTRVSFGDLFGSTVEFQEYTHAFVYATDFLLLAVFVLWGVRAFVRRLGRHMLGARTERITERHTPIDRWITYAVLLFVLVAALSLTQTIAPMSGAYQLARLIEGVLLFAYVRAHYQVYPLRFIAGALVAGGLIQATIALGQTIMQHDLGLRLFGESPLSPTTAGVAKIDTVNGKLIRAYGTFPHPNVLGAYLVTALLSAYYVFVRYAERSRVAGLVLIGILVFGLISTYSRLSIAMWAASSAFFLVYCIVARREPTTGEMRIRLRSQAILLGCTLIGLFIGVFTTNAVLFSRIQPGALEETVSLRAQYNQVGAAAWLEAPVLGVGIGNIIPYFEQRYDSYDYPAWVFQPPHNLYVLIAAETGTVGLVVFIALLGLVALRCIVGLRQHRGSDSVISVVLFVSFLVLAFFDHYFWTLQQGRLLWWLVIGLCCASPLVTTFPRASNK